MELGAATRLIYGRVCGRSENAEGVVNSAVISQFNYSYNAVGDILTWAPGQLRANSGLTDPQQYALGYDNVDQLTTATLTDTVTSATLGQQAYTYDSAGNRTTNQNGNTIITETPNGLNQLTQTAGGGMMRFAGTLSKPGTVTVGGNPATVDSNNNFVGYAMVPANTTTPVHIVATDGSGNVTDNYTNVTPNMVTPQAFTYDLNGNTISSGPSGAPTSTYGWDAADRLISVTQGANVTTYDYDGLGRRVREWVNGAETRQWIWDGLELCEERNSSNNVTKRFYGQGEQISGVAYYSTRDHLGSVQELLDGSGALAAAGLHARYSYDVYGLRSANLVTVNAVASDFGFTGHQEFDAIGLLGAPLRFYQPGFGRWLSRDPIEEAGGVNYYEYVSNSPVDRIDPTGLVDLNLFSMRTDANAYDSAQGISIPGTFTVAAHANLLSIYGPNNVPIPPWVLAQRILANPNYHGQPVVLLSCQTGWKAAPKGWTSYAQYLAYYLNGIVRAPASYCTYNGTCTWDFTDLNDNIIPGVLNAFRPENGGSHPFINDPDPIGEFRYKMRTSGEH